MRYLDNEHISRNVAAMTGNVLFLARMEILFAPAKFPVPCPVALAQAIDMGAAISASRHNEGMTLYTTLGDFIEPFTDTPRSADDEEDETGVGDGLHRRKRSRCRRRRRLGRRYLGAVAARPKTGDVTRQSRRSRGRRTKARAAADDGHAAGKPAAKRRVARCAEEDEEGARSRGVDGAREASTSALSSLRTSCVMPWWRTRCSAVQPNQSGRLPFAAKGRRGSLFDDLCRTFLTTTIFGASGGFAGARRR